MTRVNNVIIFGLHAQTDIFKFHGTEWIKRFRFRFLFFSFVRLVGKSKKKKINTKYDKQLTRMKKMEQKTFR